MNTELENKENIIKQLTTEPEPEPNRFERESPCEMTPPPMRNQSIHSHHSSELSHPSINNFINHTGDENLSRILDIKLETDEDDIADLNAFCYNVIQRKFKEAIKINTVLPSESDKKSFSLKVYQQTDPSEIKKKIVDTINSADPRIHKFIDSTINSLLLSEMKMMDRSFVSLHDRTFHKIVFTSKLKKKRFSTNYYKIHIDLLSINYL